jgi:hypothetical protein
MNGEIETQHRMKMSNWCDKGNIKSIVISDQIFHPLWRIFFQSIKPHRDHFRFYFAGKYI